MMFSFALCKNRAMFADSKARDAQIYSSTKQGRKKKKEEEKKSKPRHCLGIKEKQAMPPELTPPLL